MPHQLEELLDVERYLKLIGEAETGEQTYCVKFQQTTNFVL